MDVKTRRNNDNHSESNQDHNSSISSEYSYYNEREIEYLDRFLLKVGTAFDEEELYDIIVRCGFDDKKIDEQISRRLKLIKERGKEYGWVEVKNKNKETVVKEEEEYIAENNAYGGYWNHKKKNRNKRRNRWKNVDEGNDGYYEYNFNDDNTYDYSGYKGDVDYSNSYGYQGDYYAGYNGYTGYDYQGNENGYEGGYYDNNTYTGYNYDGYGYEYQAGKSKRKRKNQYKSDTNYNQGYEEAYDQGYEQQEYTHTKGNKRSNNYYNKTAYNNYDQSYNYNQSYQYDQENAGYDYNTYRKNNKKRRPKQTRQRPLAENGVFMSYDEYKSIKDNQNKVEVAASTHTEITERNNETQSQIHSQQQPHSQTHHIHGHNQNEIKEQQKENNSHSQQTQQTHPQVQHKNRKISDEIYENKDYFNESSQQPKLLPPPETKPKQAHNEKQSPTTQKETKHSHHNNQQNNQHHNQTHTSQTKTETINKEQKPLQSQDQKTIHHHTQQSHGHQPHTNNVQINPNTSSSVKPKPVENINTIDLDQLKKQISELSNPLPFPPNHSSQVQGDDQNLNQKRVADYRIDSTNYEYKSSHKQEQGKQDLEDNQSMNPNLNMNMNMNMNQMYMNQYLEMQRLQAMNFFNNNRMGQSSPKGNDYNYNAFAGNPYFDQRYQGNAFMGSMPNNSYPINPMMYPTPNPNVNINERIMHSETTNNQVPMHMNMGMNMGMSGYPGMNMFGYYPPLDYSHFYEQQPNNLYQQQQFKKK